MATWLALLTAVLTPVIGLVSNVLGIWYGKRLERSGNLERPPYRLSVVDRWGWLSIVATTLTAAAFALLMGTALAWITGGIAVFVWTAFMVWWGWRRMPLLTREARKWLWSWQSENAGQGGLSYRQEPAGLAERTYTLQDLSRVAELDAGRPRDEATGEVLSPDDLLSSGVHVLVTGEAGVGKSTNLRHYGSGRALRFWAEATRRSAPTSGPVPAWLPVLLSARELVGKTSVEAAMGSAPKAMLSRAPARRARWLVLVDAVDEVLNAGQRQQVWEQLLEAVREEGPCRFVISSRSVDSTRWRDLEYRGVAHYQLHPFTDEQLLAFTIRHQSGREKPGEPERSEIRQRASEFLFHVRSKGLIEVVRLPLLAKLAADMYFDHRNRDLPMRRVDLYEHSIKQWLGKFDDALENEVLHDVPENERDDVKKLLGHLDERYLSAAAGGRAAVLRSFLTDLASVLTSDSGSDTDPDLVEMAAHRMDVGSSALIPATRLAIGRVLEATGLIRDPYHNARFWHQTFAEYLAAPIWVSGNTDHPDAWGQRIDDPEFWVGRLDDPATAPGMVFAFHHLTQHVQFRVITVLTRSWTSLRRAAVLVDEGLCDTDAIELLGNRLWNTKPDAASGTAEQREAHKAWWDVVDDLAVLPMMKRRVKALCNSFETSFDDRVNALAVLARNGEATFRAELESTVEQEGTRPGVGWWERAHLADAVAWVDPEQGMDALLAMVSDTSLSEEDRVNLLKFPVRIDAEHVHTKLRAVVADESVDSAVRTSLAGIVAVSGSEGGTDLAETANDGDRGGDGAGSRAHRVHGN